MLPRRSNIGPDAVLAERDPGLRDAKLSELGEGWDNVACAVIRDEGEPRVVLRISKIVDPQERSQVVVQDVALLDFVAQHASLATNVVAAADPGNGVLLMSLVPGEGADRLAPRDEAAAAAALGRFLGGIHRADAPAGLVAAATSLTTWPAQAQAEFAASATLFADPDRRAIEAFLAERPPEGAPHNILCHNDLGDEHVIVDTARSDVVGVIDWSDAVLGDPARDFALLMFDFGPAFCERTLAAYDRPVDSDLCSRARWFGARAGVVGVAHRAREHDPGLSSTLARLRRVLAYRG
ncbi:MAG: aminoglycoside phosphotransferase family protein [Tetrasphaera sp.]